MAKLVRKFLFVAVIILAACPEGRFDKPVEGPYSDEDIHRQWGDRAGKYSVIVEEIAYDTTAPDGSPARASGVVAFPVGTNGPIPIVSFHHGTWADKAEPIRSELTQLPLLASHGMIVAAPYYLGHGESSLDYHPYLQAKPSADTAIDFIAAALKRATEKGQAIKKQLFLVGYSEGGYVTLAVQKRLEASPDPRLGGLQIEKSFAGAGPYDLSGVMLPQFVKNEQTNTPIFWVLMLLSYHGSYQFLGANSFDDFIGRAFSAKAIPIVKNFFPSRDSKADRTNKDLPKTPKELVSDSMYTLVSQPNNAFEQRLKENDLLNWVPKNRTALFHCTNDNVVPFENSSRLAKYWEDNGIAPDLLNKIFEAAPEGLGQVHANCGLGFAYYLIEDLKNFGY